VRWRRDLRIWTASCAVAALSGVAIGIVSVALGHSSAPPVAAAGTLPMPGESQRSGDSASATGPGDSTDTSTGRASRSAGAVGRTEVTAGVSATRRSAPLERRSPAERRAKPKAARSHGEPAGKGHTASGKSTTKPAKPAKPAKGKPGK
jgi:hypothetical protein